MASRMERYYKSELVNTGRSDKNKSLYKQIEDLDSYTNIEGVATIEKTNEIDISKVKEMLNNRENYKKQQQLRRIMSDEVQEKQIEEQEEKIEHQRNYDINDIISKMKKETPKEDTKYRSLTDKHYNTLKELNKNNKSNIDEEDLKELINTIVDNSSLNSSSQDDDVGLLDELKSNTIVGTASSIKKIIDEEKEKKIEDTAEIDNSFYTSSFGFTQRDFEELKTMNHKIKKSNKYIIVLLVILILVIVAGILFFILK